MKRLLFSPGGLFAWASVCCSHDRLYFDSLAVGQCIQAPVSFKKASKQARKQARKKESKQEIKDAAVHLSILLDAMCTPYPATRATARSYEGGSSPGIGPDGGAGCGGGGGKWGRPRPQGGCFVKWYVFLSFFCKVRPKGGRDEGNVGQERAAGAVIPVLVDNIGPLEPMQCN
jgi:hypothetical protein